MNQFQLIIYLEVIFIFILGADDEKNTDSENLFSTLVKETSTKNLTKVTQPVLSKVNQSTPFNKTNNTKLLQNNFPMKEENNAKKIQNQKPKNIFDENVFDDMFDKSGKIIFYELDNAENIFETFSSKTKTGGATNNVFDL